MASQTPLGRVLAAVALALLGTAVAVFVFPLMRQGDLLLRDGTRAEATVIAIEDATCFYTNRRANREYPCFRATGEWIHDGAVYRAILGYYKQRNEAPVGTVVPVIFAPDPAAAAGAVDLRFRVIGAGRSLPRSERPVYLGLLVLAGLMWIPLLRMLLWTWPRAAWSR